MQARLLRTLHRLEDGLLAVLLGALVLLGLAQIALRLFFGSGLTWAEPVSQMGVLWLALMGALGAARSHRHIAIDAMARSLPAPWRRVAWVIGQLAAAGICAALAWYGWGMVELEREAPGWFIDNVPSWWPMLAFPAGFGLLAVRFVVSACGPPAEHEGL